jgi:glutamyl-tRNA(Gln) amidotransferase subunit D
MSGKTDLERALESKGIEPGDTVEIVSSDGRTLQGVLMPHHEFSDEGVVTVKLKSGYNVGVRPGGGDAIKLIERADRKAAKEKAKIVSSAGHPGTDVKGSSQVLPVLSIVSTGGTIASYVDYRTGAVKPAITADELARSVPELASVCSPKTEVLYSVLSENMRPENWRNLAERVAAHLNDGSRGCIVPHGTDTMGYTGAALSFSLSGLTGPVVLVGSQRSSDRPSSDSTLNLLSAARVCTESDLGEVVVLMHSTTDDRVCAIHRGTRVRKCHSSRRDAFESVNEPPIGFVEEEGVVLQLNHDRRGAGKVQVDAKFDEGVAMLNFYPGLTASKLKKYAEGASGVIIAGTGLGHVHQELIPEIGRLTREGVPVCITTQCIWGSSNLNVYSTGRDMLKAGAIPLGDMLSETAYVKLSWVLGHTDDVGKCREMMLTNMRREIGERRSL